MKIINLIPINIRPNIIMFAIRLELHYLSGKLVIVCRITIEYII